MSVPGFQEFMLPFLRAIADGREHAISDIAQTVYEDMRLTAEDLKETLPSRGETKAHNRLHWVGTYFRKAGLIVSPTRGRCKIAERGKKALAERPERIDVKYLNQFPEFLAFHSSRPSNFDKEASATEPPASEKNETPEELLAESYQVLRRILAKELSELLYGLPPSQFEKVVVAVLVALGYGGSLREAGQALGRSGDEGVDGKIKEDKLGLDEIFIQAKRWKRETPVGRKEIQAFAGSLEGQRARKGIFITTSRFSDEAREYVTKIEKKIILIDGDQLASLMIDNGIGVATVESYAVKKIDHEFFEDE